MSLDLSPENIAKAKAKLVTPLALSRVVAIAAQEKTSIETALSKVPLKRCSSASRVSHPLSTSPSPSPRALTPTFHSPRMVDAPVDRDFLTQSARRASNGASQLALSSSAAGSKTQPIVMPSSFKLERPSSERSVASASPRSQSSPRPLQASPAASPRTALRRRSSVGGSALNKKPILIELIRDPLAIDRSKLYFFVPAGKMTMEHRQMFVLAQPSRSDDDGEAHALTMDEYFMSEPVQLLRKRAHFLLVRQNVHRLVDPASMPAALFSDMDKYAEMIADEGKYGEYEMLPNWTPPVDDTKYERVCIVAPTGF